MRKIQVSCSPVEGLIRKLTSTGTNVSDKTKAPESANNTVVAIGRKSLPSIPVNASNGHINDGDDGDAEDARGQHLNRRFLDHLKLGRGVEQRPLPGGAAPKVAAPRSLR